MNGRRKSDRLRNLHRYVADNVLFTICITASLLINTQALTAPSIVEHPPPEVAHRTENDVILPCLANADSQAEYTWKKDNEKLDLSGRKVTLQQPGSSGNLIIRKPGVQDNGEYQCFATNEFGTAVSTRAILKKAEFNPFPTRTDPEIMRPVVGQHLKLPCTPPFSYPKDTPYWGYSRPGDKKQQSLANDDRIMLDYEGGLYFANIELRDSLNGLENYVCVIHNKELRAAASGNDVRLIPVSVPGGPERKRPFLMWSSPKLDIAVKGKNKKIKCIFGGYPTPKVSWSRAGGKSLNSRMTHTNEGHGTELEIANVDETDAGDYECTAINAGSGPVTEKITLIVHSKPFWNQDRPPEDVQIEEEGDASFTCLAHGSPKPKMKWGVNGVAFDKLPPDSRRSLQGDTLTYRNVSKEDTQVIQCVAENEHGTILANAHLRVISEPPSFLTSPSDSTVVEGSKVRLQCRAYGAPRPKITWMRGDPPRQVDRGFEDHYIIHNNGDLEIEKAQRNDEDDYFCVAKNKHETAQVRAKLAVRQPTVIQPAPAEVTANRSDDVTLRCDVTTDPKEHENLKVEWHKNGQPVNYNVDRHLSMHPENFALTIKRSMVKDTAKYTCHANNGLDSAESSPTQLIIKDRPEAPSDLKVDSCTKTEAKVSFLPGSDNNDPITSYTVYYNVDDQPELIKGSVIESPPGQPSGRRVSTYVTVQPWRKYKFFVAAQNGLGTSEPSSNSPDTCETPEAEPRKNPSNVCSKLKGSGQLVITWDPVPREEHYGSEYRYVVGYRKLHSGEQPKTVKITDSSQTELAIHDMPTFERYEISVWAENKIGATEWVTRERKVAYSSEGKPLEAPQNFRVDKFNGTYAKFFWDPVDPSVDKIRGFFRGYRIKFWRANDPNNVRTEDVIVSNTEINLCPILDPPPSRRRRQISFGPIPGSTNKLWPFSNIIAGVAVLNSAHDGELSNTINFTTPEGPPEAVKDLIIIERGSSHLTVAWSLPASANGVIKSFILEYQVAPPEVGALRKEVLSDPSMLSRKILGLQADTKYRVTLYAVTEAGPGQAMYIDETTLSDSEPDKPRISKVEAGLDSANVSFDTTERPPKQNPGSRFYVEYAKEGIGNKWEKTDLDPHSPENWVQVKDLEPGVYFFRVVAVNGRDGHTRETRSDAMRIEIGERRDYEPPRPIEEGLVQHAGASAGWFIALMCIIILLLIILLIICCIKRSKGDMYPVYEKEKMLGRDPFAPDDAPFGEYNSSGRPDRSRSQGSLDSDDKPMESDTDSLGEYEDQDASKFNEDGSFIGLYGGKGRSRPEPTAPSMNTFV